MKDQTFINSWRCIENFVTEITKGRKEKEKNLLLFTKKKSKEVIFSFNKLKYREERRS